jgi:hypothetical protein
MLDRPRSRPPPPNDRTRRERQFRYRRRQHDGRLVVRVEVGGEILELLVRLQWLTESDAGDRRLVGLAIGRLLADSARRR